MDSLVNVHHHRMSFSNPVTSSSSSSNQQHHLHDQIASATHFLHDSLRDPSDQLDLPTVDTHPSTSTTALDLPDFDHLDTSLERQNSDGQQNGARKHKRRKLSQAVNPRQSTAGETSAEADQALLEALGDDGSPPQRKQRACDQCKQQKLKCNLVEDPFQPCDRCVKFKHNCQITDDFKRVAKRTQLADLEKQNETLQRQVIHLRTQLRSQPSDGTSISAVNDVSISNYPSLPSATLGDASLLEGLSRDQSQDAQLLLQLKQGQMAASSFRPEATAAGKSLGSFNLPPEIEADCWHQFFAIYHYFLPILDEQKKDHDKVYPRSRFLFWTVMIIALRHYGGDTLEVGDNENNILFHQLLPEYQVLLRETICKPPKGLLTVKGLCLICHWPLPISNTEEDLTQIFSGIMMKQAMQLGLHRPSNPDDFSRSKLKLRDAEIKDRLRTWAACTLVAQNISTGYGQPPDTVYDATLSNSSTTASGVDFVAQSDLHLRMAIEKLANDITRDLYLPKDVNDQMAVRVDELAAQLEALAPSVGVHNSLDPLYHKAVCLHLRLHVLFEDPDTIRYEEDIQHLYSAAVDFLSHVYNINVDLRHAPNYIMQMMFAAAAAIMKMLSSSLAVKLTRARPDIDGANLFWTTITQVRKMTVIPNDLPLRLAEVFAQMGKASGIESLDINMTDPFEDSKPTPSLSMAASTAAAESGMTTTTDPSTNPVRPATPPQKTLQGSMTLKRKARQSMSVVYDSIWRWKEDLQGHQETLEITVNKNPTSPQQNQSGATTNRPGTSGSTALHSHRGSISLMSSNGRDNGIQGLSGQTQRRASDLIGPPGSGGPAADLGFQGMFSGFEGYSEFELFDPLAWALQPPFYTGGTPPPQGLGF